MPCDHQEAWWLTEDAKELSLTNSSASSSISASVPSSSLTTGSRSLEMETGLKLFALPADLTLSHRLRSEEGNGHSYQSTRCYCFLLALDSSDISLKASAPSTVAAAMHATIPTCVAYCSSTLRRLQGMSHAGQQLLRVFLKTLNLLSLLTLLGSILVALQQHSK